MLVVSGRDVLQLRRALGRDGAARIQQFVRSGGAFFGINAGGYFGSAKFEGNPSSGGHGHGHGDGDGDGNGDSETLALGLGFFPGVCRCERSIAKGESPATRIVKIETGTLDVAGSPQDRLQLYSNGGGVFLLDSDHHPGEVEVLARFAHENSVEDLERGGAAAAAAIVYCQAGEGNCVLASPHLE